jgi:hypothetical protein
LACDSARRFAKAVGVDVIGSCDMRRIGWKTKSLGALLLVGVAILLFVSHARSNRAKRCYLQVTSGMTLAEVQAIMGRAEGWHDDSRTPDGEFERSWTFPESGERLTVVFDPNGLSRYKEHGPADCGVTLLMDKKKPRQ